MGLIDQISSDIRDAINKNNKTTAETLQKIKENLLEAQHAKGVEGGLSLENTRRLIMKMYDERKEAAQKYVDERNAHLAAAKEAQAQVIAQYMPGKMTPAQIADAVKGIIVKVGARGKEDVNKVMEYAKRQLNGKADPKEIEEIVIYELEDKPLPNP